MLVSEAQVLSEVARWAVQQSPYHRPEHLEVVLDKLHSKIGELFIVQPLGFWEISEGALHALLSNHLREIPEYMAWNDRKNGNESPFAFTSAYDTQSDPDDDFIDLDALEGNVVRSIKEDGDAIPGNDSDS